MKKTFAKLASMLLCFVLLFTLFPGAVHAAEDTGADVITDVLTAVDPGSELTDPAAGNPAADAGELEAPDTFNSTPSIFIDSSTNGMRIERGDTANMKFSLYAGSYGSEKYVVEIYTYQSDYYQSGLLAASASNYFYRNTNLTLTWDTLDKDLLPGTYLMKAYTQYYSNNTWYNTTAVNCYLYVYSINPFTDVAENASYYFAVMWAYKNGVISGTTKTTFSPDDPCRRYQVVQMLYKLHGKPAVSASNPFKDVKTKDSFYNAVLWAVNSGIVSGTSKTTFSPQNSCERYQIVQMLYKMAGKPSISATNPFTDVKKTNNYYNAVMWAVKKGITAGTSSTKFSPHKTCTRYQIAVFLYKYNNIYHVK